MCVFAFAPVPLFCIFIRFLALLPLLIVRNIIIFRFSIFPSFFQKTYCFPAAVAATLLIFFVISLASARDSAFRLYSLPLLLPHSSLNTRFASMRASRSSPATHAVLSLFVHSRRAVLSPCARVCVRSFAPVRFPLRFFLSTSRLTSSGAGARSSLCPPAPVCVPALLPAFSPFSFFFFSELHRCCSVVAFVLSSSRPLPSVASFYSPDPPLSLRHRLIPFRWTFLDACGLAFSHR